MDIKELKQKAKTLKSEIAKLEADSQDIAIIRDSSKIRALYKQLAGKKEELSIIEKILNTDEEIKNTKQLLSKEKDKEMLDLARDELVQLEKIKQDLHQELDKFYNASVKQDYNECILEIRAGTGGEEAALFASDLFRMYAKYSEAKGWKVAILSRNQTKTGGFKEIICQISGEDAYKALQYENGVHRVQRIPTTESSGRIHTSASSVVVYPLIKEEEVKINPNEIKVDVFRSSGPGGQSVNRTDSAVRITHTPTRTVVTCQDEKSQHKNKKKALSILASKLASTKAQEQQEKVSKIRKSAIKTGDRSAKIRTYNFPQNRVTDHRIKKSWHNLKVILNGNLDQIMQSLHA